MCVWVISVKGEESGISMLISTKHMEVIWFISINIEKIWLMIMKGGVSLISIN